MAQSLDAAAKVSGLLDSAHPRHVLLITDGWQYCVPEDPSTRFLPVNSVANLKALGIKAWIVGFGQGVDALTLNKMADAAQTKVSASCDPASDNLAATNNCYYQANNPNQLVTALQAIVSQISTEVCDGEDNNCDTVVDGPNALCENGGVCIGGVCQGASGGCDCEIGPAAAGGFPLALLALPLLGLLLVVRRMIRRG